MRSYAALPEGYRQILHIDLQNDKKLMLIVNVLGSLIMVAMIVAAAFLVPLTTMVDSSNSSPLWTKMLVLGGGFLLYMVLHEAVHGIFMRRFCDAKVKFGFTGMYAFAGSEGYYCRRHYFIIGLAPVVVWGIVLGILNVFVPYDWFYVVYLIQASNVGGAAGDLYVSWRMSKLPKDILVRDSGVTMTVYSRENTAV